MKTKTIRVLGCSLLAVSACVLPARASKLNPVRWSLSADPGPVAPGSTVVLHLHAEMAPSYHLYSLTTPSGGPIRTKITLTPTAALDQVRVYQGTPDKHKDPNLNVPVETFNASTDFLIEARVAKNALPGPASLEARTRYQACSDELCLPPVERVATASLTIQTGLKPTAASVPGSYHLVEDSAAGVRPSSGTGQLSALPLIDPRFLLLVFGFGLAAIFTPCVFPTVLLTISYFLGN